MYLPRDLISHLYTDLVRTQHPQSPPVLLLVALDPDALCACRILTALLKRDYIQHNIIPVSGYGDLSRAGETRVQPMRMQNGGSGGTIICLGVGGLVDLAAILGLEAEDEGQDALGGVELWVFDARRPWNLGNVFGGRPLDQALGEVNGNARAKAAEVEFGQIRPNYKRGRGGIIVYDDGDVGELEAERQAYFKLEGLPPIDDDGQESDESEAESESDEPDVSGGSNKRKAWSDADEDSDDDGRARQRRRANSSDSIPVTPPRPGPRGLLITSSLPVDSGQRSGSPSPSRAPPSHQIQAVSARRNRRRILRLKRKHEATLFAYYSLGSSYSEPISSLIYSLASDLGHEDNNTLWYSIVGVSSLELYGRSMTGIGVSAASESGGSAGWGGERGERIRQVLRDEVRRLNPPDQNDPRAEIARGEVSGEIPITAASSTDTSIRLSPEPRFLLVRHWSLYDSMLHSPYLAGQLQVWRNEGKKRLHKLLAKMGIALDQSKQSYPYMDMELKRGLRQRLLKNAPLFGLEGLVPPPAGTGVGREGWGFVRSWGWTACLSAVDVGVIIGAILEVGRVGVHSAKDNNALQRERIELVDEEGKLEGEEYVKRFWDAYDALENVESLKLFLPITQVLHRAILRAGTSLLSKHEIRHLRTFRLGIIKDGPDASLFTHPGALTKLALWVGEAILQQEKASGGREGKKGMPLVLAGMNKPRGIYVVVGTGGGGGVIDFAARKAREEKRKEKIKKKEEKAAEKERERAEKAEREGAEDEDEAEEEEESEDGDDSEDDSDDERTHERGFGKNRFGNAFQEVVDETNARVRIDSFEHCVVEVKIDDFSGFLESLSAKTVVG